MALNKITPPDILTDEEMLGKQTIPDTLTDEEIGFEAPEVLSDEEMGIRPLQIKPIIERQIKTALKATIPFAGAIPDIAPIRKYEEAQAAFKWSVLGMPEDLETIERIEQMNWADVIRESYPMLKNPESRLSRSVMAQFPVEMAGTLLEVGTKPSTYIAWGAMERLVPFALKGAFKKLPPNIQQALIKERFLWGRRPIDLAYKELGLKSGASPEAVKVAWRKSALKWHPDRAPAGQAVNYTRRFIKAQGAYDKIKASTAITKEAIRVRRLPDVEPRMPIKPVKAIVPKPTKAPEIVPLIPKPPKVPKVPKAEEMGLVISETGDEVISHIVTSETEVMGKIVYRAKNLVDAQAFVNETIAKAKPITEVIEEPPMQKGIKHKFTSMVEDVKDKVDTLKFYPKAPPEFRDAIRKELIGGITQARDKTYSQISPMIFGGLSKREVSQAVELIFARGQLSRIKVGKGDPRLTTQDAQRLVDEIMAETRNPDIVRAADKWFKLMDDYRLDMIKRGKFSPEAENLIEEYAPIYVQDYTSDWEFTVGIPTQLKKPYRKYIRTAKGTTKEYKKDLDTLLGHVIKMEHDNLVEDFITKWASSYDVYPTLLKEGKLEAFGVSEKGVPKQPRPGRIYEIEGKKYWGYNPSTPFARIIYPLELDDKIYQVLGGYKKTYLLPEDIYKAFKSFSERGNEITSKINLLTSYWKSWAIYSHYPSFNINNLVGDTWMAMVQSPQPHLLLGNVSDAISYMTTKTENFTPFQKQIHDFIIRNSVLDSAFIGTELARVRKSGNPAQKLLYYLQQIAENREKLMRSAQASYFIKKMNAGQGEALKKYYKWIDTAGLSLDASLGKIARETLIDYNAMSKPFRRIIRGFVFPFGTWYIKGSGLMWRFMKKHFWKAITAFMSLPIAANAWNYFDSKRRKMEEQLPDYVRHRIHTIIGETPEGNIKVWSGQLPQDALIGTKIFSIASNEMFRVMYGEKTIKEAALDTIKEWGIKEKKGILYLTTPVMRYIQGLIKRKDPYDNSPIYPIDVSRLTSAKRYYFDALYLLKCCQPFLSTYMRDYSRSKDIRNSLKTVAEDTFLEPALGIREVTPKTELVFPNGSVLNWDAFERLNTLEAKEASILLRIEDDFIASSMYPGDYLKTDAVNKNVQRIRELYGDENWNEKKEESLNKRVINRIQNDPGTLLMWAQNNYDRAKTLEDRIYWNNVIKGLRAGKMVFRYRQFPVTVR